MSTTWLWLWLFPPLRDPHCRLAVPFWPLLGSKHRSGGKPEGQQLRDKTREVLGSVGSVSVVLGSVDRFGSIDICVAQGFPGGSTPPDPPEKRLRRARRRFVGRFGVRAKTHRSRFFGASGTDVKIVSGPTQFRFERLGRC